MKYMSLKNMTEEEKKARKQKQKAKAQKKYYESHKEYYKNYSKQWAKKQLENKDKEIDRLNNIINEAIKYNKELAKIYDLGSVERSNADTNLIILQEEEHMQIMKEIAKLKVENND